MTMTATDVASALSEAIAARLADNVVRLTKAYDEDYRERAPRGQEGAASSVAHGIARTSSRLNDALVAETTKLSDLTWLIHLEVDDVAAPHGKWIDQPVDEIRPVNAKVLRWFGYHTGQPIFAQKVHPSREHEGWWGRWTDRLDQLTADTWDNGGF